MQQNPNEESTENIRKLVENYINTGNEDRERTANLLEKLIRLEEEKRKAPPPSVVSEKPIQETPTPAYTPRTTGRFSHQDLPKNMLELQSILNEQPYIEASALREHVMRLVGGNWEERRKADFPVWYNNTYVFCNRHDRVHQRTPEGMKDVPSYPFPLIKEAFKRATILLDEPSVWCDIVEKPKQEKGGSTQKSTLVQPIESPDIQIPHRTIPNLYLPRAELPPQLTDGGLVLLVTAHTAYELLKEKNPHSLLSDATKELLKKTGVYEEKSINFNIFGICYGAETGIYHTYVKAPGHSLDGKPLIVRSRDDSKFKLNVPNFELMCYLFDINDYDPEQHLCPTHKAAYKR